VADSSGCQLSIHFLSALPTLHICRCIDALTSISHLLHTRDGYEEPAMWRVPARIYRNFTLLRRQSKSDQVVCPNDPYSYESKGLAFRVQGPVHEYSLNQLSVLTVSPGRRRFRPHNHIQMHIHTTSDYVRSFIVSSKTLIYACGMAVRVRCGMVPSVFISGGTHVHR